MNIFIVSNMVTSPWGGSEQLWSDTAQRLVEKGHRVTVCVKDWGDREHGKIKALGKMGCRIVRRSDTRGRGRCARAASRFLALAKVGPKKETERLSRENPDLVLISSGYPWILEEYWEPFLKAGVPYAILVHVACEQWWPDDRNRREQFECYNNARALYFVSNANRKLISDQLLLTHANSKVVRNTTNRRSAQVLPWPDTASEIKIAFVGRLEPAGKGFDLLLAVLAQKKWRERNINCSIFGEGGSADSMRGLATRLGATNVTFFGQTDSIEAVWATHQALVLPSRYEGLPIVIVEAMLAGRPCIVTDVAGNSEMVVDGISGFVAEAPTISHFDQAMERAWSGRARWREMGEAAAARAREIMPTDAAATFAEILLTDARALGSERTS